MNRGTEIVRALIVVLVVVSIALFSGIEIYAAYNHIGDQDSANFRSAYPDQVGTKLDSCTTCHRGSDKATGDPVTYGSCQWCHFITEYGAKSTPENLDETLNLYGKNYKDQWATLGRTAAALLAIEGADSDADLFSNQIEISALTYPGDATDDPSKVPAPSLVLSLDELERMPLHTQFLLMNASKSDDSYTKYNGIALENLIEALMLDEATGVTVYAPDGFATYHPFIPNDNPNSYHVFGIYPQGTFYYDERADIAIYPADPPNYENGGWCDYSSPSAAGRGDGDLIFNPEGLKMMLAFKRDGEYLTPGVLNLQNKLDGEGPFRIVPPQKNPGWPDQRSSSTNQNVLWPYDRGNDHNAGFSSRTVTMVKVEPLPAGTTDINTMEAGWPYVDENKIILYGSIDPHPVEKLNTGLDLLINTIESQGVTAFKNKSSQKALVNKIEAIKNQVAAGAYSGALTKLKQDVLQKTDGCLSGAVDANDWVHDLQVQQQLCSEIQKLWMMLVVLDG